MVPRVTMQDLVTVVAEYATSEAEVIATVVHLVNSGKVRLVGRPRGARFNVKSLPRVPVAA
ncbi:MAG TPA: hypothetical protein VIS07_21900 [Candidatus Binatia bacterium]